jgi:hypothetical protein
MLVRIVPRMYLNSSGRQSMAQLNLLSFPVWVLSRRENRIYSAEGRDGGVVCWVVDADEGVAVDIGIGLV